MELVGPAILTVLAVWLVGPPWEAIKTLLWGVRLSILVAVALGGIVIAWWFVRFYQDAQAASTLMEIAGIAALVIEVRTGAETEKIGHKLTPIQEMVGLYIRRDFRGFCIAYERYEGTFQVSNWEQHIDYAKSPQEWETEARQKWKTSFVDQRGLDGLERWESKTIEASFNARLARLWTGFALLFLGSLIPHIT